MSEQDKFGMALSSAGSGVGDGSLDNPGQSVDGNIVNPAEFVATLQNTFQSMQDRFTEMMDTVMGRMDEMADRLNELEKEVTDLVSYAGGIADTNQTTNKDTENIPPSGPSSD